MKKDWASKETRDDLHERFANIIGRAPIFQNNFGNEDVDALLSQLEACLREKEDQHGGAYGIGRSH